MNNEIYLYPAPAKLNLMLRVVGRRDDGYHLIETVFRFIDLLDTVKISLRNDGDICLSKAIDGVDKDKDLTVRAAKLLKEHTGVKFGANISVDKRIPMGAGLGGGSSDAATVLLALNHLWNTKLTRKQLMNLGLKLGADVPVFIFGRNSFASGVGEELTYLSMPNKWYVVLHPKVHISTAHVFSSPMLTRNSPTDIMRNLKSADQRRNDLEDVVCSEYPLVSRALFELKEFGSALMSGSGSCVFLECNSKTEAYNCYEKISKNWAGYVLSGLSEHPLLSI